MIFSYSDEPNNLLMTGGAGAGKTHIACAFDKNNPNTYKLLSSHSTFDFIEPGQIGVFPITFRAVRFLIDESGYEVILTNLDAKDFSVKIIKQLYAMRWGIETSFRELKHILPVEDEIREILQSSNQALKECQVCGKKMREKALHFRKKVIYY